MKEEEAADLLQAPEQIFNFDESNFLLTRKKGNVLGPVNYKSFLQTSNENDKEVLTVLMGYSAAGKMAPPMIIYAYKHIRKHFGIIDVTLALKKNQQTTKLIYRQFKPRNLLHMYTHILVHSQ